MRKAQGVRLRLPSILRIESGHHAQDIRIFALAADLSYRFIVYRCEYER